MSLVVSIPEGVAALAEQFDVVVLGGGPGGYAAALYGAAAGLHIALIEEDRVGGTCLQRGCIPAKELLQTAEVLRTVRDSKEFGVEAGQPTLDLSVTQARKQQVIDKLTKGLEGALKGRKVTVIPGRGEIIDAAARHVRVSDGSEVIGTKALILATGSAPRALPGLPFDGEKVLSSDHVLKLAEVPKRVAIIGGGAIGSEFASYFCDTGSEVTLLEALPNILAGVDPDVAKVVARAFAKRGMTVSAGVSIDKVEVAANEAVVHYTDAKGAQVLPVDKVVVSIGRRPRSENIGLENSGVVVTDRGFVQVDGYMRTAVPGVYAVGDLCGTAQLAHVAFSEAIVAIRTILGEHVLPIEYGKVPWGIYCHPEVSFCGLTEAQAREQGYDVMTSTHHFTGNGRAMIIGETQGIAKVVADKESGTILGVHIAGPWATELLGAGYVSVNWEATVDDLAYLIQPHPTLTELFGETVLSLTGRGLHG